MDKRQRSVYIRLLGMQLASVCISLLIIGVLFGYMLQKYYFGVREWDLLDRGHRMVELMAPDILDNNIDRVRQRINTLAESSDISLWVLATDGSVLAGSKLAEGDTTLTIDRAEAEHVLSGNSLTKKVMGPRYQSLLVVLPVIQDRKDSLGYHEPLIAGALAMRAPLSAVGATINNVMRLVLLAGVVAGTVVFALSLSMAKGFARPLEQLQRAALDIAHGRFRRLALPPHSREVDHLVQTFNYASEKIEETTQQQAELNRLRREFLASLSHELRAPLTSLKGFLEIMEAPLSDEERETYRRIMFEDTLYLERLVNDVRELTRMESGQFQLKREWVDLGDVVANTIDRLQLPITDSEAHIQWERQPNLPKVYVDTQRCHQVFTNLLLNAVRYTQKDPHVEVAVYASTQWVHVRIRDHGPGIPAEHLPHIWEMFYKIDKARTRGHQGSGLGLAIVKQIVEAHQGRVSVTSEEGRGTTFIVQFPTAHPADR